ncbi:MAG: T9SS type A sorting domain-containing protein [Candidatus Kapaibacteriota bacterium]
MQIQTNSDYYVKIEIIDIFGNMLQSFYDFKLQIGLNKIFLDTYPYSSGIYFIKIQTKNNCKLIKFSLYK